MHQGRLLLRQLHPLRHCINKPAAPLKSLIPLCAGFLSTLIMHSLQVLFNLCKTFMDPCSKVKTCTSVPVTPTNSRLQPLSLHLAESSRDAAGQTTFPRQDTVISPGSCSITSMSPLSGPLSLPHFQGEALKSSRRQFDIRTRNILIRATLR